MPKETVVLKQKPPNRLKQIAKGLLSIRKHMGTGVWSLTGMAMESLKRTTPRSDKPGRHLADQYSRIARKDAAGWIESVTIFTTSDFPELLWYLEYGTRPHEIRGNPLLAFEIDGKTVFTTIVHHPGTRPYGFVRTTTASLESKLARFEHAVIQKVKEAIASGQLAS